MRLPGNTFKITPETIFDDKRTQATTGTSRIYGTSLNQHVPKLCKSISTS